MLLSLVRQAVIIKTNMPLSKLLGNYEYMYSIGLLSKLSNISIEPDINENMAKKAFEVAENFKPSNDNEEKLRSLILEYEITDKRDKDMETLFEMGKNEENPWKV
ncbi:protein of unknown function [Acetitomaculum ruminis DSM 5522]|uniref:DUF3837 domain-containing protein n=1 Tax=Acetitomaculum ruminis DSM 5522 TaxID=1120918 RepID=A0A1I0UZE8_9FIRM|nr:DUF3837 family protein [Acetitomaculum ruminis]SFA69435.1 protein of unknown function [Acetitomaculum ruminis DSM 5522]